MELIHRDDGREGSFVLKEGTATVGEITYVWAGDRRIVIGHTGVRRPYEGRGLGRQLVDAAAGFARQKGIGITPLCPFARALFDKSASYDDVKSA
jgi:predicted GNAT family acetyltransferase